MKLTFDLRPAAVRVVKSVSRQKKITLDEAASQLILSAVAKPDQDFKSRHGIPLARNDGVGMTADEVSTMLNDG